MAKKYIEKACESITNIKAKYYYFALWKYAYEQGSAKLRRVNMNKLIREIFPDEDLRDKLLMKRKEFIDSAKKFGVLRFYKEVETSEQGINNLQTIRFIDDFSIINKKGTTYFTGNLPNEWLDDSFEGWQTEAGITTE